MFGRKDATEDTQETVTHSPVASRVIPPDAAARNMGPANAMPARRPVDVSHSASSRRGNDRGMDGAERKLTVGRGLSLSGEITACDVLVVEGKVEAKLTDGKLLEITESGQFKGSVEIENADIAGRYDGQLVVHGRLTVRGTGRVSGMVKYGELEINAGGQIIGELQVVGDAQATTTTTKGGASFKSAAKFTALTDDDEETTTSTRKAAGG